MKSTSVCLCLLLAIIMAIAVSDSAEAQPRLVIVLDKSGSMDDCIRPPTGNIPAVDAVNQALFDNWLFGFIPNAQIEVLYISNTTITNITGGFVAPAVAAAAINGVQPDLCTGDTPLADAICLGVNDLVVASPGGPRFLTVSSDGIENASSGGCSGPDGDPPPWGPGTWQDNCWNAVVGTATFNVRQWDATSCNPKSAGESDDFAPSDKAISSFMEDLANATGGEYAFIGLNDPLPLEAGLHPPVPTNSVWGIVALCGLLLLAGSIAVGRRQSVSA